MKNKFVKAGILSFFIITVVVAGSLLIAKFYFSQDAVTKQEKENLPSPVAAKSTVPEKSAEPTPIPEQVNWDVPFTSQAPKANWDFTHEEACEEATILMAQKYFEKQDFNSSTDADEQILKIVDWENKNLGFFESTTADETAEVVRRYLGLNAEAIDTLSVDAIKEMLASGKLVVVPEAGRELGNPYYKAPGPLYHMLLLKGYTGSKFITNDAGTRRGANYPYKFATVLDANHDWNGGNVDGGARKIIIIWK